jgi:hypothetical protein
MKTGIYLQFGLEMPALNMESRFEGSKGHCEREFTEYLTANVTFPVTHRSGINRGFRSDPVEQTFQLICGSIRPL